MQNNNQKSQAIQFIDTWYNAIASDDVMQHYMVETLLEQAAIHSENNKHTFADGSYIEYNPGEL